MSHELYVLCLQFSSIGIPISELQCIVYLLSCRRGFHNTMRHYLISSMAFDPDLFLIWLQPPISWISAFTTSLL